MRVEFKTDAHNERSRRALAALPAEFEGVFRKHMLVRGGENRDSAASAESVPTRRFKNNSWYLGDGRIMLSPFAMKKWSSRYSAFVRDSPSAGMCDTSKCRSLPPRSVYFSN